MNECTFPIKRDTWQSTPENNSAPFNNRKPELVSRLIARRESEKGFQNFQGFSNEKEKREGRRAQRNGERKTLNIFEKHLAHVRCNLRWGLKP